MAKDNNEKKQTKYISDEVLDEKMLALESAYMEVISHISKDVANTSSLNEERSKLNELAKDYGDLSGSIKLFHNYECMVEQARTLIETKLDEMLVKVKQIDKIQKGKTR